MSYDHRKTPTNVSLTLNIILWSMKTTKNSIEDEKAAAKDVCHMIFLSFDAGSERRIASKGGFSGLKWGLWMRPCVSVISALALLDGFQMQKVENCKKPKHASEVKKARRPPNHPSAIAVTSFKIHDSCMRWIHSGRAPKIHSAFHVCPDLHRIDKLPVSLWSSGPSGRSGEI